MTVADLAIGQRAAVLAVGGDPAVVQRLGEFGLFDGETVELIGFAPLGDPLELLVGQTRLSLRKSEAAGVTVQPLP
jgi:ferrous iron transport protein A